MRTSFERYCVFHYMTSNSNVYPCTKTLSFILFHNMNIITHSIHVKHLLHNGIVCCERQHKSRSEETERLKDLETSRYSVSVWYFYITTILNLHNAPLSKRRMLCFHSNILQNETRNLNVLSHVLVHNLHPLLSRSYANKLCPYAPRFD